MLGMVETPGTKRRSGRRVESSPTKTRRSKGKVSESEEEEEDEDAELIAIKSAESKVETETNGHASGRKSNGSAVSQVPLSKGKAAIANHKVDSDPHFEFGGPVGVTAIMTIFPLIMYYMWIGATYYNGKLPLPARGQSVGDFLSHLGHLVYTGAFPSLKAWAIYWTFFVFEAILYIALPGLTMYGQPLPHEGGKRLKYHCSGVWSFYVTTVVLAIVHASGIFKLYTWIDEFGPIMSVAILSGFLVSIVAYVSALWRGAEHRMTGSLIYDFFMGAELNPRLFGILDFKMFFEVRIPWYILFFTSVSAAARQYEKYGYVSGEVGFLVMAHFLYVNACAKGEHYIIPTWDMYYEKWGFMLIFWNLAGVPLSYCHCTLYLANHDPSVYQWNKYALGALYVGYLFVYWIWDTANSQKNHFRQTEHGAATRRKAFPVLPWQVVENPRTIPTTTGQSLLADGWYGYARKIHYTCDLLFALSWGLITGFDSPFPWFYPFFFACMITHRAARDIQRCRRKYGDAWKEYERQVPYLFIPVSLGLGFGGSLADLAVLVCHLNAILIRALETARVERAGSNGYRRRGKCSAFSQRGARLLGRARDILQTVNQVISKILDTYFNVTTVHRLSRCRVAASHDGTLLLGIMLIVLYHFKRGA